MWRCGPSLSVLPRANKQQRLPSVIFSS
uniref:Uncharacterized protein n=1 Tax=Arundo donax TaxID=35708 RepID=A0A0A9GWM2_ARUDO